MIAAVSLTRLPTALYEKVCQQNKNAESQAKASQNQTVLYDSITTDQLSPKAKLAENRPFQLDLVAEFMEGSPPGGCLEHTLF